MVLDSYTVVSAHFILVLLCTRMVTQRTDQAAGMFAVLELDKGTRLCKLASEA